MRTDDSRASSAFRTRSAAFAMMLAVALTTGCRHTTQSRNYPPPPALKSSHGAGSTTAPPIDDNFIASGRIASFEMGVASWYGPPYANHQGANGEIYNVNAMTAAHRTLPMGTMVEVTNITTHQVAVVRITDRGPFVHGRTIDLSIAAAKATGVYIPGTAQV
jgi:rare lipoprotein A